MASLKPIDQLRTDHARLREHLRLLQQTLASGNGAGILQPACRAFQSTLRRHMQREARCAVRCVRRLRRCGVDELRRLALEHHEQLERLQIVWASLKTKASVLDSVTSEIAVDALRQLERCCEQQEADLFPFLEAVTTSRAGQRGAGNDGRG